MQLPHYHTARQMQGCLAQVIPAWFSEDLPDDEVARFLTVTLADAQVWSQPDHVVLIADGQERVGRIAEEVANALPEGGAEVHRLPENTGKGGALVAGLKICLAKPAITHVVVRDADGDHLASDVPNLYRLARQMQEDLGSNEVLVVGGRSDVTRPMGLERGEYERLLNDVVWNALVFARAAQGKAVNTQYWAPYSPYPDLQSGFKLYTRTSAQMAITALTDAQGDETGADVLRWGCELLPAVAVVASGGTLGQVARLAIEEQPVTAYGGIVRHTTYGRKVAWCLRRLGLPSGAARQILDNALLRCPLYRSQAYRGELLQLRRYVLAHLGVEAEPPPAFPMLS